MTFDLLIKNGEVVRKCGVQKLDIAITNGQIVTLDTKIDGNASQVIDAAGLTIFPGMIDVHVHLDEPGRTEWEGFNTGSAMLAAGGCTSYFDMPLNGIPSTVTGSAMCEKAALASHESAIDFALWGGLVPGNEEKLKGIQEMGAIGFKAFLSPSGNPEFKAVDDRTLLRGMRKIADMGAILSLHSESAPIVTLLQEEKNEHGQCDYDDYLESRPIEAELEAVSRALLFSRLTGCKLHFVHISSAEAVGLIAQAKSNGQDVTLETCAHYLLYSHEDFRRLGVVGKCAPPLRPDAERKKLVQALIDGKIDMVSSDHSPCEWKDKQKNNVFEVWGGISGGQFTLLSVIELALHDQLPLSRVADWTAVHPAERFHLAPQKGTLEVGADADLVLVSLNKPFTVQRDQLFQKNKFTLYEGHTFPASIQTTINRGKIVFDGERVNKSYPGNWLKPNISI